jgi:hypothetical protein
MLDHTHVLDAARRFDPTGTSDIRSRFRSDMSKRWSQLRQLTSSAITSDNILGLGPLTTQTVVRSADPVHEFQSFIDAALTRLFGDGTWTQHYLDEAAARARSRVYRTVAAMGPAQFDNTHIVVNSAAAVELQGVVEAVSQRTVRAVSMGLLARARPQQIARDVAQAITTVGKARGDALVDVSINSAFNHMTLDTLKTLGFTRVAIEPEHVHAPVTRGRDAVMDRKTMSPGSRLRGREPSRATYFRIKQRERELEALGEVEVVTAGDDKVCPICQGISEDGPYEIDRARSLIPAHPHCRCAFVPYLAQMDALDYSPGQRRDWHGKFTSGAAGGGGPIAEFKNRHGDVYHLWHEETTATREKTHYYYPHLALPARSLAVHKYTVTYNGKEVARVLLSKGDNQIRALQVKKGHHRKGLVRALMREIEKHQGIKLGGRWLKLLRFISLSRGDSLDAELAESDK